MALVSVNDLLFFPNIAFEAPGSSANGSAMDAAAHLVGNVMPVYKAGNIRNVWIYPRATITSTDSIRISLQGVSSGNPDGTVKGAGNAGYVNVDCEALVSTQWNGPYQLGVDVAVTQGEYISSVIDWVSYSAGTLEIAYAFRYSLQPFYFYGVNDLGAGSWTKSTTPYGIALEYDDGTYSHMTTCVVGQSISVNTGSTPNAVGNYVKFPISFRAVGICLPIDLDYDATLQLQSSDGTALANCTAYAANRQATAMSFGFWFFDSDPAATYTIAADTYYRVVMLPTSGSSVTIRCSVVPEAAALAGLFGGSDIVYTSRSGSTWSQTDTYKCTIGLVVDQIDIGSGGGGAPRFGDMTGGLK